MFLNSLIDSSIQGGILIAALAVSVRLFPALPSRIRVWLWRIVMLKLAFGLLPFAAVKLNVLPRPALPTESVVRPPSESSGTIDIRAAETTPGQAALAMGSPIKGSQSPALDLWMALWAFGALLVASRSLLRAKRSLNQLRSATEVTDPDVVATLRELAVAAGRRSTPRLLTSCEVQTAIVLGGIRPSIVIPEGLDDPEDMRPMLAHEIAHICAKDLEWNAVVSAIQSLFFFHPLVWLATRAGLQAQETAADETAIRLAKATPRRYAEMLVRATVVRSTPGPSTIAGLSVIGSTSNMQDRLKNMRYFSSKPSFAKLAFSTVFLGVVAAMTPAYHLGTVPVQPSRGLTQMPPPTLPPTTIGSTVATPPPIMLSEPNGTPVTLPPVPSSHHAYGVAKPPVPKKPALKAIPSKPVVAQKVARADIRLDNADVRRAIASICDKAGISFSINEFVQGHVTLHAKNMTIPVLLQNVARQVGAACTYRDGIYEIVGGYSVPAWPQSQPKPNGLFHGQTRPWGIPVDPRLPLPGLGGGGGYGASGAEGGRGGGIGGGAGGAGGRGGQGGGFGRGGADGQGGGFGGGGAGGQGGGFGGGQAGGQGGAGGVGAAGGGSSHGG